MYLKQAVRQNARSLFNLKRRMEEDENSNNRKHFMQDSTNLDGMQVQMATAREFPISIRLKKQKGRNKNFDEKRWIVLKRQIGVFS